MIYMEKKLMNELKRFDKYQLLIAILSASSFALSMVFFFIMYFTAQIVVEEGELQKIVYDSTLQGIYSFFLFAYILGSVWFFARLITYKMRLKEQQKEKDLF